MWMLNKILLKEFQCSGVLQQVLQKLVISKEPKTVPVFEQLCDSNHYEQLFAFDSSIYHYWQQLQLPHRTTFS